MKVNLENEEDPLQDAIRHPFQYLIISLSRESPRKAQPKTNTSQKRKKKKKNNYFLVKMPAIYEASTECRGVYVYEHIGLLLFCFSP